MERLSSIQYSIPRQLFTLQPRQQQHQCTMTSSQPREVKTVANPFTMPRSPPVNYKTATMQQHNLHIYPRDPALPERPSSGRWHRRCGHPLLNGRPAWCGPQWHPHLVATTGEFVGTFLFLFLGYSGHLMILDQTEGAAAAPGFLKTVYVGYCYGFSLLVTSWAFFRISGGQFNPAVTLGLCLSGKVPWVRLPLYVAAQLLASLGAGAVAAALFPGNMAGTATTLAAGVGVGQGLVAETFFTAYLVFVILMLAGEKSRATALAPVGIGLALFVTQLPGVFFTGGSLNPARSLGCSVVAPQSFPTYHWIYWVGPALGALLAAGFFRFLKTGRYEEANPGQDAEA